MGRVLTRSQALISLVVNMRTQKLESMANRRLSALSILRFGSSVFLSITGLHQSATLVWAALWTVAPSTSIEVLGFG